ncbi:ChaB-A-like protein [Lonomia obliqua multiple nucleopolyhedrovirus]|uniref:ChaB-A-like protein n=1 Tax=Lonomia obliqua multiple nucleopolyhedrovirus TaxID=134394 RepID=A0A126FC76_9ABAC|nr:ChaB-A-like protein [Lonomia obliqua multiple nucleopolyhedrovirus]AKN80989.1 ChaB-A-like protein [Lonomia obliqua multiple nucleopolyhedrovirus]
MLLPKKYQTLPYNGKRIFEKIYNRSLNVYKSERVALKLACCAVRKKYLFLNNTWQARPDANQSDTTSTDSTSSSSSSSSSDTNF